MPPRKIMFVHKNTEFLSKKEELIIKGRTAKEGSFSDYYEFPAKRLVKQPEYRNSGKATKCILKLIPPTGRRNDYKIK